MVFKKCTSLAVIALAASVWIGCSSKEDQDAYDKYYGAGSKSREAAALVTIQNDRKAPKAEAPSDAVPAAAAKPARKPVPAEVSTLLNKHACFACHQAYDKVIGPAYSEVAKKKYSADEIVALVHNPKPENWPGYPPMAPLAHVPKADIVIIANWINTL
jgi:cytochrome c551/c552